MWQNLNLYYKQISAPAIAFRLPTHHGVVQGRREDYPCAVPFSVEPYPEVTPRTMAHTQQTAVRGAEPPMCLCGEEQVLQFSYSWIETANRMHIPCSHSKFIQHTVMILYH